MVSLVAFRGTERMYVLLSFDWMPELETGKDYNVLFRFHDGVEWRIPMYSIGRPLLNAVISEPELFMNLAHGQRLSVSVPSYQTKIVSLEGSMIAIKGMIDCAFR